MVMESDSTQFIDKLMTIEPLKKRHFIRVPQRLSMACFQVRLKDLFVTVPAGLRAGELFKRRLFAFRGCNRCLGVTGDLCARRLFVRRTATSRVPEGNQNQQNALQRHHLSPPPGSHKPFLSSSHICPLLASTGQRSAKTPSPQFHGTAIAIEVPSTIARSRDTFTSFRTSI